MNRIDDRSDDALCHDDEVLKLHLEVAHRADELAQRIPGAHDRRTDLQCWLEAERQILALCDF